MFLSWTKVKKAKSYVVYQYNYQSRKYNKVAVRKGYSANYYNIPNASSSTKYKYVVRASKNVNGSLGYIGKRSYAIWAVAGSNESGNALKITTSKTSIRGSAGKSIKLTSTVLAAPGKPLLSSNIRWYSSNSKIASVNKETGKIKLIKKGKCKVWAKAHNGKNSEKIIVTVK